MANTIQNLSQRQIMLSFSYLAGGAPDGELRTACWVIRDFGSDQQYSRLIAEIRKTQYSDRRRYDELWRNVIWTDNARERVVLDILLRDDRVYQGTLRYSDVARGELKRIGTSAQPKH